MEIIVQMSPSMPCSTKIFTIDGIDADIDDFGRLEKEHGEEQYTCNNFHFVGTFPTDECLKKYHITLTNYKYIAETLESKIYRGYPCSRCT